MTRLYLHAARYGRLAVLFLPVLVIQPFTARAQNLRQEWVRTFGLNGARTDEAVKIISASDGIVVAGSSSNGAGDSDYVVIKFGVNGEVGWEKWYDSGGGINDALRGLALDPAGNVFVTGTSKTVKFSSNGTKRWELPYAGRGIVAGTNFVYVTGFSDRDFATVQLKNDDTRGEEGWQRSFDSGRIDYSGVVALDKKENVFVLGVERLLLGGNFDGTKLTLFGYGTNGTQTIQTSSDGYAARTVQNTVPRSILFTTDGSAYIMGTYGTEGEVAKVNPSGRTEWSQGTGSIGDTWAMTLSPEGRVICVGGGIATFGRDHGPNWRYIFTNVTTVMRSVVTTQNGDIYAAGRIKATRGDFDVVVVKFSSTGVPLESRTFDSPHHGNDVALGLTFDVSGNLYVAGYSTTASGGSEFLTIKYSVAPQIENKANGAMQLQFQTIPNSLYGLQATTNFVDWQGLSTNRADTAGVVTFEDAGAASILYRFYRGATVQ